MKKDLICGLREPRESQWERHGRLSSTEVALGVASCSHLSRADSRTWARSGGTA